MDKLLLTPTEAAEVLGIGRSKVYELMRSGTLRSVRIDSCRRISVEDLNTAQVQALAEAVPAPYRMLILLAAWSGARWGEPFALSRDRIDLERGTMRVDRQYVELEDNSLVLDSPKSAAAVRTVHIPPHLLPELRTHIDEHAGRELIFTTGKGDPLSRGGFRSTWVKARERAGLPDFRFHDLRHTGNTLAASTGASTKELTARMGHASMRAALIYQHATADRDACITAVLSRMATEHEGAEPSLRSGPPLNAQGRGYVRVLRARSGHAAPLRLFRDLAFGTDT